MSESNSLRETRLWGFVSVDLPEDWSCVYSEDVFRRCDCSGPGSDGTSLRIDREAFYAFTDPEDDWIARTMLEGALWSELAGPLYEPEEREVDVVKIAKGHWMRRFVTEIQEDGQSTPARRVHVMHLGLYPPAMPAVFFTLRAAGGDDEAATARTQRLEQALREARFDWSAATANDPSDSPAEDDVDEVATRPVPRDMTRFKAARFWDFITVEVPECWEPHRQEDGTWGCHEVDDEAPGELYLDFDVFNVPADQPGGRTQLDLHDHLKAMSASKDSSTGGYPYRSNAVEMISPNHGALHLTWESRDDETGETICHS